MTDLYAGAIKLQEHLAVYQRSAELKKREWYRIPPGEKHRLANGDGRSFIKLREQALTPDKSEAVLIVERLLIDFVTRHQPRRRQDIDELLLTLAGFAWQLHLQSKDNLKPFYDAVSRARKGYDPEDRWLAPVELRDHIGRITKSRKEELARVNAIYEVFADGYVRPDTRRGVRPDRHELLLEARRGPVVERLLGKRGQT